MTRRLKLRFRYNGVVPSATAPAFAAGVAGTPVILGQPKVGATCTFLPGDCTGYPTPTHTYQWYRGEKGDLNNEAIPGATASSYTFTNAEYMRECWLVDTATNSSGTATTTSWRIRCIPASATVGHGATADAGQTNDPATAAAYSATTLYEAGTCVTYLGSTYFLREPYSYGRLPTDTTTWTVVPLASVYYIDPVGGLDSNAGTSAAPWQTAQAINNYTRLGTATFVSYAPANAMFLIKGGTTLAGQIMTGAGSNTGYVFGKYGAGARPVVTWAPPSQADITAAGVEASIFWFNSSGHRIHNIDMTGNSQLTLSFGSLVGTPAAADVLTFSNGTTGTITYIYVSFSATYYVVSVSGNTATVVNPSTWTSPGKSGSVTAIALIDAVDQGSQSISGYALTNSSITNFSGGTWGPDDTTNTALGDCFFINTAVNRCSKNGLNGAGVGGGHSSRMRAWFNTVQDSGSPGGTQNHNMYLGGLIDSSVLFNNSYMTADYANSGFVYHGSASNVELAWNVFKGCRSGIGINDGYSSPQVEQMYLWHIHHNVVQNIGQLSTQNSASLGWEITLIQNSRVHDNVTIDATDSAIYQDRNTTSTHTELGNTVFAHNSWWNANVYWGAFLGGAANLIVNLQDYNNIFATNIAIPPVNKGYTLANAQYLSDANLFYRTDAGAVINWDNGGTAVAYSSASALHTALPAFEARGLTGNPLFTSTTLGSENLAPQAGSIAKAAGIDVRRLIGYASDISGVTRSATTPSIGAYE